jgi:hypothetical protein
MGKGGRSPAAASAAKAADALERGGGGGGAAAGGFGGASAFSFGAKYIAQVAGDSAASPGSGAPAAAAASAIVPPELDGELAQALQRLSKRDATTRLKAAAALRALVAAKPEADVLAALPAWSYLFARLVMDAHHGVRAEAAAAMGAFAAAAGRGLAPSVRAVVPPWLLAQHDPRAEVAAVARAAFEASFPGAKGPEAVRYCRAEVREWQGKGG